MELEKIRKEIDETDSELIKLFEKRMRSAEKVAEYKAEKGLMIMNTAREREITDRVTKAVSPELAIYAKTLYNTLFDVSCSYQCSKIYKNSPLSEKIKLTLEETEKDLPSSATVAFQGTEGSYSQAACEKLFALPTEMYFNDFKGVFDAVGSGMCRYGVLPFENSVYGSVTEVVDLLGEYGFSIVKSVKTQICHALLAKPGHGEIKEVISHTQALGQCADYLKKLGVKITACENTAIAAKTVAQSERDDIAAIASPVCADIYGLEIVKDGIADSDNNYTRFVCISKKPEIYRGANKISVITTLSHKPGALYELISKFAAAGINLTKIESRPIPGKDFEFKFYLEMAVSVYSKELISVLSEMSALNSEFKFLGAYSEI